MQGLNLQFYIYFQDLQCMQAGATRASSHACPVGSPLSWPEPPNHSVLGIPQVHSLITIKIGLCVSFVCEARLRPHFTNNIVLAPQISPLLFYLFPNPLPFIWYSLCIYLILWVTPHLCKKSEKKSSMQFSFVDNKLKSLQYFVEMRTLIPAVCHKDPGITRIYLTAPHDIVNKIISG